MYGLSPMSTLLPDLSRDNLQLRSYHIPQRPRQKVIEGFNHFLEAFTSEVEIPFKENKADRIIY